MFAKLAALGRLLGCLAVSFLALLVGGEVVTRSLLGLSFEFAEELSGYLLVAITFLAAADSFASGSFMRVDVLYARLPTAARATLDRVLAVLAAILCGGFCWYLARLVLSSYRKGVVSPNLSAIPLWLPQLAMVVGMALLAVACLRHALFHKAEDDRSALESRLKE